MGRNGAGKSTLLRCMVGLTEVQRGSVRVESDDPRALSARALLTRVGMVPQEPADLLWSEAVGDECAAADADSGATPGSTWSLFERLTPGVAAATHPRDLSEGQRLSLALSLILVADAKVLLLDEPTRGLDYPTKARLVGLLRERAAAGHTIIVATHDVELVAEVASRTVVLAEGEVVTDGPTSEVVIGSPQFAPQIAKVLAPLPWLTVGEVVESMPAAG